MKWSKATRSRIEVTDSRQCRSVDRCQAFAILIPRKPSVEVTTSSHHGHGSVVTRNSIPASACKARTSLTTSGRLSGRTGDRTPSLNRELLAAGTVTRRSDTHTTLPHASALAIGNRSRGRDPHQALEAGKRPLPSSTPYATPTHADRHAGTSSWAHGTHPPPRHEPNPHPASASAEARTR
jgi:hypothetical protein